MKKEKALKIAIFAIVLLIPIIYSFFYLKSYWNPYGDLTGLKIAIVNLDEGEDNENQGKDFVKGLEDDGTFTICPVSLDDANEGMQNGDYYATITIPSNFTKYLNSAKTTDKQVSTITYSPNQASNYLASQIINSAVKTMEINLKSKISKEIASNLSEKLKEVPDSLEKISDGSEQILDGSKDLNSGIKQISDGTQALNNQYAQFDEGIKSAYAGSQSLNSGLTQTADGVNTLNENSARLDDAITQINSGLDNLTANGLGEIGNLPTSATALSNGTSQLNGLLNTYTTSGVNLGNSFIAYLTNTNNLLGDVNTYISNVNTNNTNVLTLLQAVAALSTSTDPAVQAVAQQAQSMISDPSNLINTLPASGNSIISNESTLASANNAASIQDARTLIGYQTPILTLSGTLAAGTQELATKSQPLATLGSGIASLKSSLGQVQSGTHALKEGVGILNSGVVTLRNGGNSLSDGLSKLDNGSSQVKSALNALTEGTASAYTGSTKLVNGAKEFNEEIKNGLNDTNEQLESLNGIEEFTEDPVEFKTEPYGEVSSYGVAFTPLFLCIGLWVGALMCYVVLYYDQKHRFKVLDSGYKNKFLQNIVYIGIGAIQGVIVGALLKIGLGFEVQNMALYYLSSILVGITFVCIIQCLIRNFGDIGKLLALIILVLQLAASGGTFPIETIDKGFKAISPYLPMTYSIKLFREILVPTETNFKAKYIILLLVISIITATITYIVDFIRNKKQKESKAQ